LLSTPLRGLRSLQQVRCPHAGLFALIWSALAGCGDLLGPGLPRVFVVSGNALVLTIGEQDSLHATIEGPPITSVLWSSRDTAVATVSQQGIVAARGPGRTHIVAERRGNRDSASVLVKAPGELPRDVYRELAIGGSHSCALGQGEYVLCWGTNWHGELGIGRPIRFRNTLSPVPVLALRGVAAMDAGMLHTCAIDVNGRVYCWGDNLYGQLGDGTRTSRGNPRQVHADLRFTSISAGSALTCGIVDPGDALCWGQIGSEQRRRPVRVDAGSRLTSISAGGMHACAVTVEGDLKCWGRNDFGQLGDGTTVTRSQPTSVAGSERFRSVSAGYIHTCAVGTSGAVYCWGNNFDGRLGIGMPGSTPTPTLVALPDSARHVSAGNVHSCAVTTAGKAYCWGDNIYLQLGNNPPLGGNAAAYEEFSPVAVSSEERFRSVDTAGEHTCALALDGRGFCWGYNGSGQLGIGRSGALEGLLRRPLVTRVVDSPVPR
jgi:alpha-tubulin suppressor-like RCC1 family protein